MIASCRSALGVSVAAVALLLWACQSMPSRLFTLEPVMPISIANAYPLIRIDAVQIPPAIDRSEITIKIAPGEFKISDVDRWAAPLGRLTRQALSEDLIARLPPRRVLFPYLAKGAGVIGITVDVIAFGTSRAGAQLHASWAGDSDGAEPVRSAERRLDRRRFSGTGSVALANAHSVMVAQLADGIAARLSEVRRACF